MSGLIRAVWTGFTPSTGPTTWRRFRLTNGAIWCGVLPLLTKQSKKVRLEAAKAWSIWEARTSTLKWISGVGGEFGADDFAVAIARIECHYFLNDCFLVKAS